MKRLLISAALMVAQSPQWHKIDQLHHQISILQNKLITLSVITPDPDLDTIWMEIKAIRVEIYEIEKELLAQELQEEENND